MMNLNPQLIEQAKAANSAEELLALAKENNIEMTEEEANAYYAQFHAPSGELDDDELDNVSGGGCHTKDGRLVVTVRWSCNGWLCKKDESGSLKTSRGLYCLSCGCVAVCDSCKYCTYEKGLWLCNHPSKRKVK